MAAAYNRNTKFMHMLIKKGDAKRQPQPCDQRTVGDVKTHDSF